MRFNQPFILTLILVACDPNDENGLYVPDSPSGDTGEFLHDLEDDDLEEEEIVEEEEEDDLLLAEADHDTFDDPLFAESFLGSGAPRFFTVDDDVSAVPGDTEDWVGFTTPAPQNDGVNITFMLECEGTVEGIRASIWDDDGQSPFALGGGYQARCGEEETFRLDISHDYLVRIYYPYGAEAGDHTAWSLTVSR